MTPTMWCNQRYRRIQPFVWYIALVLSLASTRHILVSGFLSSTLPQSSPRCYRWNVEARKSTSATIVCQGMFGKTGVDPLEGLTVAQLTQIAKDTDVDGKDEGILAKLVDKKDLIRYLRQNASTQAKPETEEPPKPEIEFVDTTLETLSLEKLIQIVETSIYINKDETKRVLEDDSISTREDYIKYLEENLSERKLSDELAIIADESFDWGDEDEDGEEEDEFDFDDDDYDDDQYDDIEDEDFDMSFSAPPRGIAFAPGDFTIVEDEDMTPTTPENQALIDKAMEALKFYDTIDDSKEVKSKEVKSKVVDPNQTILSEAEKKKAQRVDARGRPMPKELPQREKKVVDYSSLAKDARSSLPPIEKIPHALMENMKSRGMTKLLPIQEETFDMIYEGEDCILQSPTGSGKTLAFVLPLLSMAKQKPWKRTKIAQPRILTIVPSRELARQVGKEYERMAGRAFGVATVFGGVPLERHISMLKSKPQIVVGTPGRLRELMRENYLEFYQLATIVLDEADILLDRKDNPDVFQILEELEDSLRELDDDSVYQMVLCSATINKNVQDFATELEFPDEAYVKVDGEVDSKTLVESSKMVETPKKKSTTAIAATTTVKEPPKPKESLAATVGHWHISCKTSVRPEITSDLISVMNPRMTIIFVPTRDMTEAVASYLAETVGGATLRVLHGEMSQAARSRCIKQIREDHGPKQMIHHHSGAPLKQTILVATDVASRGLDLPNVDLVVQFGLPRLSGKEGTINNELYAHRTGRTGRFQAIDAQSPRRAPSNKYKTNNAVTLFDPATGEGKLIDTLVEKVDEYFGVQLKPMPIPSSEKVVNAAYRRLSKDMQLDRPPMMEEPLAEYFRERLIDDDGIDESDPEELLDRLAEAMVILSKLDPSMSAKFPASSLLNGDRSKNTLRVYRRPTDDSEEPLKPPMVTNFCKPRGSGKLGRIIICEDGSAVFDLPKHKAQRLLETIDAEEQLGGTTLEFALELPSTLPEP